METGRGRPRDLRPACVRPDLSTPASRPPTLTRHPLMWPTKRKASELDALLTRLHARRWRNETERDEMLRTLGAAPNVEP